MSDLIRPATVVDLGEGTDVVARTQHFTVRRIIGDAGVRRGFASAHEMFLLLPFAGARLASEGGGENVLPGHSANILPAGRYELDFDGPAQAFPIMLVDGVGDAGPPAINEAAYVRRDERVKPVRQFRATTPDSASVRSFVIDEVPFPKGNPRIKFFQNSCMSINWVEYSGPRDRTALSPHSHADFEQASLAVAGNYIHHSRIAWGRNADLWQEDRHEHAGAATMLVVPPEVVHTTEGVGEGLHILIDVFAPPRPDFIASGLVHNAQDYAAPELAGAGPA